MARGELVLEPGCVDDLGPRGRSAWSELVEGCLSRYRDQHPESHFVLDHGDRETAVTASDWIGFPVRVEACLGRERALAVLDPPAATESGGSPPRALQEEYIEWRSVSEPDGSIRRVELTTELAEYWRVLAATRPERVIELVSQFARRLVTPDEVYRGLDRPVTETGAVERGDAFAAAMLTPADPSPLNDGREAICCMLHRDNNLDALARLAVAAARALLLIDEDQRLRYPSAPESIAVFDLPAYSGRMSDPVIVERLGRLALEGRQVALDDPPGVYIHGVEHTRLRAPGNEPVDPGWFTFSRGAGPRETPDGRPRYQRVELEIPSEVDLTIDELHDSATEEQIRGGAQIAELVQLAIYFRVSGPEVIDPTRERAPDEPRPIDCAEIHEYAEAVGLDGQG